MAQERGWACTRRPPSSRGLEPQHRWALCSHEGLARGHCARAEFVSQPRFLSFLSVVLKESVESADWAVLLHPRTEAAAPGRERGEALQGSHHLLPSQLRPPRLRVPHPQNGWISARGHQPWSGGCRSGLRSPRALPLPENPAPSFFGLDFSISRPSSPQACREGERGQVVDAELNSSGLAVS